VRAEGFEDLLKVNLHSVAGVARVSKDGAERLALREFLHESLVEACVETGGEGVVRDEKYAVFQNRFLGDG
jgi:hypothetical protein